MTAGLLGFGRLGRLVARRLSGRTRLFVHDPAAAPAAVRAAGGVPATFREACSQDAVLFCVPMRRFEAALARAVPHLRPGALVLDSCSVKERPVRAMRRLLPRGVWGVGTHPCFGPDSAADTLEGRKLVLCPVRVPEALYGGLKRLLRAEGLKLVEMTPREHDRQAARSLVLTHFIGRALLAFGARPTAIDTEGYARLLRILQTVRNDSWELYRDMNALNAFAPGVRRGFQKALESADRRARG